MFKLDHISDGNEKTSSRPSNNLENVILKSFECVEPISHKSNSWNEKKILDNSSTLNKILKRRISCYLKVSNASYYFFKT